MVGPVTFAAVGLPAFLPVATSGYYPCHSACHSLKMMMDSSDMHMKYITTSSLPSRGITVWFRKREQESVNPCEVFLSLCLFPAFLHHDTIVVVAQVFSFIILLSRCIILYCKDIRKSSYTSLFPNQNVRPVTLNFRKAEQCVYPLHQNRENYTHNHQYFTLGLNAVRQSQC